MPGPFLATKTHIPRLRRALVSRERLLTRLAAGVAWPRNVISLLGILLLTGIVTKNAILIVDFAGLTFAIWPDHRYHKLAAAARFGGRLRRLAMAGLVDGKVVLVTGAASGIGRATALLFAREGARGVVVADIAQVGGEETVRQIEQAGSSALFVRADVSRAGDVAGMVEAAVTAYGRLDCAHNNAGVSAHAATADATEDSWDHVQAVDLKGVWLCLKYELAQMLRQGSGAIVNTASIGGLVGLTELPAYCAAKGGVISLTRTAALEVARQGIRVNCVCPGLIRTPMTVRGGAGTAAETTRPVTAPMGRLGEPEEVAEAVVWLASDRSSFVTGHALIVDGGRIAE